MTYLELTKKLGLTKLFICLMDELGYTNREIAEKLQITEPTIYNARKEFETLSEALKIAGSAAEQPIEPLVNESGLVTEPMTPLEAQVKKDLRNPDVQEIINAFQDCFGTTSASKYDRFAASRLAKKYGAKNIVGIIRLLSQHRSDKYTPVVNSVRQIEQKWVNIGSFFNRVKSEEAIDL